MSENPGTDIPKPKVKVLCIAGARPNFMKIAPLMRALGRRDRFEVKLVHTGQHYDDKLSKVFFEDLRIPRPDIELEVGSGSLAGQTAEVMKRFEPVLANEQAHAVLVVGDVNSTVACSLVAARFHLANAFSWKHGVRTRPVVIHVEAGLRSFDDDMPEEINRKVTDGISDVLFVSEESGIRNLAAEGVPSERCHLVGNVMIDTLLAARGQAMSSRVLETLGLSEGQYGLVTLHRPSNVDDETTLRALMAALDQVGRDLRLVFPVHPRTRSRLTSAGIAVEETRILLTDPIGYLDFLRLMASARVVLTDSGGIQEETTVLGVPCITLRKNTERPVTVTEGTNRLVGTERDAILAAFATIRDARPSGKVPSLWDGEAADRIAEIMDDLFRR
jgi:UDP-N-acetylglucosamine 2-epimerase (non-hydrolysing)